MTAKAGVRFGPVVCRLDHIEDCRPAARILRERLRFIPQYVFLDAMGNVRMTPGYAAIPDDAARWLIGTYNQNATIDNIAADLASELRIRVGL